MSQLICSSGPHPFKKTSKDPDFEDAIEQIDIGGPWRLGLPLKTLLMLLYCLIRMTTNHLLMIGGKMMALPMHLEKNKQQKSLQ